MSDDNLRIKPNINSTAESKQIKPDNAKAESCEAKHAEIEVGQELTKSSKTTADVQTEQTTEQKAAQKEAEESANIADIESMAELPDDTTDNADSSKEKALTERTNDLKNLSAEEKRKISAMTQKELALMTNEALKGKYERAEHDFNAQLKHDGWTGDVADIFSKIWNNKLYGNKNGNTADLVREDLAKFKKDMEKLNSASQLGTTTYLREFKKIFGVEFNSLNIAAYQKAETTYIKALSAKKLEDDFNSELSILLYDDKLNEEYKTYVGLGRMPVTYVSATKKEVYEREYQKLTNIIGTENKTLLDKKLKDEKAETLDEKYKILHQVAKSVSEFLENNTKAICNGKNSEDVKKDYETAYKTAFGVKNDIAKRVNDYNISQQRGAGIVQSVAVIGAVTATCLSMGMAAPLGATALASAGTATVATGVVNVSDRYTSGTALDELKGKGFLAYLKKGAEITDWNQVVKASVTSGVMTLVFAGQSYAVSNLCIKAGMSATSAAVVNSAAFIGTGLGTEKLLTGEITVEGATFTVLMAFVGGVLQIRQIKKQEASMGGAKETKLGTDINNARETMGFSKDAIITPEQLETQWKTMAKKIHPDTGGSDIAMATLNSAHDTLKANITRINDFISKTSKTAVSPQNQTKQQTPFTTDEVTGNELIPVKTTSDAKPATIALPLAKGEETAVTIANTGFNESVPEYNVAALVPQNETTVEYTETPVIKNPTHETTETTILQDTGTDATAHTGIKSCFDPKNFDAKTVEILDKQMAKTREICKKTFHPERFKKAEEMGLFKPIYSKSPENQLPLIYIEELTIQTPENVQNYFELIEHSNPNVPAEDILGIAITSSPEVIARVKEMMYIPERGDNQLEVNLEFATQLSIQSDAKFKRTRELAYIPQRGSHQYSAKDIMDIEQALISDEIYQRAKEHKLFDYNPAFEQLGINVNDIEYMAIFFTETNFKHFNTLLELNPQMNLDKKTLMKLADMDREQIMKALPLIIEYKNTRPAVEIAELSKNLKDFQIPYLEWALKHNGEYEIKATSQALRMKNHEHFIGIGGDAETQIYTIGIRETKTKLQLIKTKDGLFIADASTESSADKPAQNEKDKNLAEKAAYFKKIRKLNYEPKSYQVDDLIEFIKTGDLSGELVYQTDTPFSEGHAEITLPDTKSKISKTPIAEISQLDTAPGQKNAERIVYRYNQDGTTVVNDWGTGLYMKLSPKENGMSVIEAVGNKEIRLSSEIKDGMIKITNDTTGETFITSLQPLIDSRTLQRKLLKIETIPDAQREERLTQLFKKLNPTTILNLLKLKKTFPNMQFPFIENALESFCGGEMKALNAASEVTLSDSRETVAHEAEHGITDYYDLTSNEELLALHKKEGEINKGIIRYLSQYATDGQMGDRQRGLSELSSIMTAADEYGAELGSRVEATRKAFPQTTKALAEHRMLHYENLLYEFRLTEKAPAVILYRANKNIQGGKVSGLIPEEEGIIQPSLDKVKLLEEKIIQSGSEQKQANTKIYKENYLTNINVMPEIKAKCIEIAENFGVYIFVNNESTAETLEAISHIEDELLAWESAKGKTETFNHPTIININASNSATLKSNSDEIVNINASSIVNVGRLIRYEMLKRNTTTDIPWLKDNIIKEVMPQKGLLHKRIDIDNCKYIEELVKAGINPELIKYAYTSPEDFVTIALTGNKSAYSEEFRKVLMTLGASELSLRVGNTESPIPFSPAEIKTRTDAIKNAIKSKAEERIFAKMLSPERAAKLKAEYITSLLTKNTELDAIFQNTDIDGILAKTQGVNGKAIDKETIISNLRVLNIPISEIKEFYDVLKAELSDEDIFKKLIQTLDVYPTIKNHQFFNLIPLTFKDVFTLKEAFQRNFYPSQEISDIIEAKEDLYLYEVSEKILSPSNLNEFKELSKKLTDRSNLMFSKVQFLPQIQINGKPLNLRVKNRFEIPNSSVKPIDDIFLIDCNMFTLELFENSKIAEAAIKHFGSDTSYAKIGDVKFEYPIETKTIIEKLKSGKTLVSQEIHALTEILLKLYSDFPEIKEEIEIVMNTESAKAKKDNISNLITAIRNEIGELPRGIEISDHFLLRMVDRNILTALSLKSEYEYSIRDLFYQMLEDAKKVQKEGNSTVALDSEKEITPRIEFKIDKQNEKITFGTIVN